MTHKEVRNELDKIAEEALNTIDLNEQRIEEAQQIKDKVSELVDRDRISNMHIKDAVPIDTTTCPKALFFTVDEVDSEIRELSRLDLVNGIKVEPNHGEHNWSVYLGIKGI